MMVGPELECDVIMRGGIASGIVYPPAVARLAETYRLRSIGGTSAGAIAAAAAAAAEYGRREGTEPRAFEILDKVTDELSARDGGKTSMLLRLFQPQRETRSLFRVVVSLIRNSAFGTRRQVLGFIVALLRSFPLWFLLGALPGLYACVHFLNLVLATIGLAADIRIFASLAVAALIHAVLLGTLYATLHFRYLALATVSVLAGLISWGVLVALQISPNASATGWQAVVERIGPVVTTVEYSLAAIGAAYVAAAGALLSGALAASWNARAVVPDNLFGLCAGVDTGSHSRTRREPRRRDRHLIDWLSAKLQELAGRGPDDPPLTVGDLLHPGPGCPLPAARSSIEIALMTTDITRGTSHCFPNLEGADGWRGELYYRSQELRRVLPASVVDWMDLMSPGAMGEVSVRGAKATGLAGDGGGFLRLPRPEHLPIIFGARLSMSFPLLISAVPLYTPVPSRTRPGETDMRRCWFSDGGLTSNFPIHLFDAPVPSRPTFGISLAYGNVEIEKLDARSQTVAAGDRASSDPWRAHGDDIIMATENATHAAEFQRYNEIETDSARLGQFFSALMDTSLNWYDTQMTTMPGYRDRIVQVRLKNDEGGYNLDMAPETIATIATKGRLAGELLGARFAPGITVDPKTGQQIRLDWDNHRWVRYRAFIASLEAVAWKFRERVDRTDGYAPAGVKPFDQLIVDSEESAPSYRWSSRAQYEYAIDMTNRFVGVTLASAQTPAPDGINVRVDVGSPDPKPLLRVMPPDEASGATAAPSAVSKPVR